MDDNLIDQRLAQVVRLQRLLNFRLMQVRHTNQQLLARSQDLIDQARLIQQASEADIPAAPPSRGLTLLRKDSES